MISFGNEEGYHSLDGIQVETVKEWSSDYDDETKLRGFVEIVDDIIENNSTYGLKGVCIDTLDTFISVGIKEVLRQHKKEKGTACKTLNEAFAGYGRGKERLFLIADAQIERLRDAGLCVFYLCHIKNKEKTDLMSGEKYEQITNNLTDDIYSHFSDAAQVCMVGTLDREITEGKITSEQRVVYLRGNSVVDAGGRFTEIKEKIELSPKAFLEAFEEAVKASMKTPKTDKEIEKMRKEEAKDRNETAKRAADPKNKLDMKFDEEKNAELITQIKAKFGDATEEVQEQVKVIMNRYDFAKFSDKEIPTRALELILELLGE